MQIVIPMSGFGERFRKAGYKLPKPLIKIEGKPIIAHVIDMFPGEKDFIFICNAEHLSNAEYNMRETLEKYCPTGRIVSIPAHKLGPVYAVLQAESLIDAGKETIINYCDFTCYWDWKHFRKTMIASECDGSIPAYKGFHPHSLGSTNYAYMREREGWVLDIQEKQPYTDNRMQEYASSGTYYFRTGQIALEALKSCVDQNLQMNGEFYVSLAYKPLLAAGKKISVYPLQHFMQWGTPEDVAEYKRWSDSFKMLCEPGRCSKAPRHGTVIVPMAGLGKRFADEGYTQTKPLIPVSGAPMVVQAVNTLPAAAKYCFVLRSDMPGARETAKQLSAAWPGCVISVVDKVTEGQACTALLGLEEIEKKTTGAEGPITFGACDFGSIYSDTAFQKLTDDPEIDILVWGVRGHPNAARHPQMYGWINVNGDKISSISVKKPLSSPANDPIVLGTFTFKNADVFRQAVQRLFQRNGRINGEFYLDSCINDALELGFSCRLFEVDSYLSWGTPNDLQTFEYWQSCFHKWPSHPYRLEKDCFIPAEAVQELENRYQSFELFVPKI